jgi:transposase
MLIVETIAKIRIRHHVKKESIKQIARELNLSRNTVRKALREDKTAHEYSRDVEVVAPKLEEHKEQLIAWLKEDNDKPKKQRCSARKLYERLAAIGYQGAYDSIQRFVKKWQQDAGKIGTAFIPLRFAPGEAYQFDWSQETVEIGGAVQVIKAAHFRLSYSRLQFVITYPRETQEMLFDAHVAAFLFFGGIPVRGIYDNMKTAVDTVFTGKDRKFNSRFIQMLSHYLVEPTACTPAAGWEKGQVENQVGNFREHFFVPRLKMPDMDSLNLHLKNSCIELAKNNHHPEQKNRTIHQVFYEDERAVLRPLVHSFDGYVERHCKVSSTCLVQFDRNRYSVECSFAHAAVSVRSYANRIIITAKNKVIGEHKRQFGRDKTIFNPWHYVPLLERKPGALRNGAPFHEWALPDAIQKIRELLMPKRGGDKQVAAILLSISQHGLEAVTVACELAITDKVISAEYILNLLGRLYHAPAPSNVPTPDNLQLQHEPESNCNRYDTLLRGVTNHVIQ